MYDSDLFITRTIFPDSVNTSTRIESYFMSAKKNNKLLLLSRELMYAYLKKYNFIIEYWLFYDFFEIAAEEYPEEWEKVVAYPRADTLVFAEIMFDRYDKREYDFILGHYPFHKLSYKITVPDGSNIERLLLDNPKYEAGADKP